MNESVEKMEPSLVPECRRPVRHFAKVFVGWAGTRREAVRGQGGRLYRRMGLPLLTGSGGAEEIRTPDPHNAIVVLYQLSYDPTSGSGEDVRNSRARVKIIC